MGFAERAAARKKSKDLKNELKILQKRILDTSGEDKAKLVSDMRDLQAAIELGAELVGEYEMARLHLSQARGAIKRLLDCMAETPVEETQVSLKNLMVELGQVYHDCVIRDDDLDFQSTVQGLKQLVGDYSMQMPEMSKVMLRSELENVKAVLDDTAAWTAPDFLALGYYFLHEDKAMLRDMENEQRNQFVGKYFQETFMDELMRKCCQADCEIEMRRLLKEYLYT